MSSWDEQMAKRQRISDLKFARKMIAMIGGGLGAGALLMVQIALLGGWGALLFGLEAAAAAAYTWHRLGKEIAKHEKP